MAVSTVSPAQIKQGGIVTIQDLGRIVAGAQINFAGGFTQPTIRGVSTLTTGAGFENNVAIYVDGFYSPDNVTINQELANVENIQVLKGPQGALYGRNATGGAILITTKSPSKTWTGDVEGTYSRFDDKRLSGYISGPINDGIRFSIAGSYRNGDGYNKELGADGAVIGNASPVKQRSLRAKLAADITDNLKVELGYNYGYTSDARGLLFTYFQYTPSYLGACPPRACEPFTAGTNHKNYDIGKTNEGTFKLDYTTPIGTFETRTSYAQRTTHDGFDYDGTYSDIFFGIQNYREKTLQQSADFHMDKVKGFDLIAGVDYYHDTFNQYSSYSVGAGAAVPQPLNLLKTNSIAFYADGTLTITDHLFLDAGARYTDERKEKNVYSIGVLTGTEPYDQHDSFHSFTPRASLRYEVAPRTDVYFTFSKGFRTGGYNPNPVPCVVTATSPNACPNGPSTTDQAFKPEKITSYEIGFKTANRWMRFDIAGFYYDYRDLQVGVTIPNPSTPNSVLNVVENAPKARIYGMDTNLTVTPVAHLSLRAGLALLSGKYTDFPNAVGNGLSTAAGLNVTNQPQDWSGNQMARAPHVSGNAGVDYDLQAVFGGSLDLGASANFTSKYALSNPSTYGPLAGTLANVERYRTKGYTLVALHADWTDGSKHFNVGVFGNNVFNKHYLITYNGGAFGDYRGYGEPATYGVRAGYHF